MFSPYPGFHEVLSALSEFFRGIKKGNIWWYNILRDNKGRISHLLWLYPITAKSILLSTKLVALKRKNSETILIVKINEWQKLVDYFGVYIEAESSRVRKRTYICPYWVYTNTFVCKAPYIKATPGQIFLFLTTKSMSVRTKKDFSDEIAPNIFSALRDLYMSNILLFL